MILSLRFRARSPMKSCDGGIGPSRAGKQGSWSVVVVISVPPPLFSSFSVRIETCLPSLPPINSQRQQKESPCQRRRATSTTAIKAFDTKFRAAVDGTSRTISYFVEQPNLLPPKRPLKSLHHALPASHPSPSSTLYSLPSTLDSD